MARPKKNLKRKRRCLPTEYDMSVAERSYQAMRSAGLNLKELASILGVSNGTLLKWRKAHPSLEKAIKKGRKEFADTKVKKSLKQRALGYSYQEVTVEYIEIGDAQFVEKKVRNAYTDTSGNTKYFNATELVEGRKIKITHKQVAPDVTACIFWLCNRMPGKWQNVHSKHLVAVAHDHTGKVDHNHAHAALSPKQLAKKLSTEKLEELRDITAEIEAESDDAGPVPEGRRLGTGV